MKLRGIEAYNVLSFGHIKMDNLGEITILVGPNSSGKTNFIRLIKLVMRAIVKRRSIYDLLGDYVKDLELEPCYIKLHLELDDEEIEDIMMILRILFRHIFSKPTYLAYCVIAAAFGKDFNSVQAEYNIPTSFIDFLAEKIEKGILDSLEGLFRDALRNIVVYLRFNPKLETDLFLGIIIRLGNNEFVIFEDKISSSEDYILIKSFSKIFEDLCHDLVNNNAKSLIRHIISNASYGSIGNIHFNVNGVFLKSLESRAWSEFSIGNDSLLQKAQHYLSKLSEKYLYMREINRYYTISEIILRIITSKMLFLDEIRGSFHRIYGLDSFKRWTIIEFSHENIPRILFYLKNSPYQHDREVYYTIKDDFKRLVGLDFDVVMREPSGESTQVVLDLKIIEPSGKQFSIDLVGAGMIELLSILTVINLFEGCVVFLDEPALHVHPRLQVKLLDKLKKARNQVFMITHSPYFISIEDLDNIVRVFKDVGETCIVPLRDLRNESWFNKIRKFLEQIPELKLLFFAEKALLAEGFHEYYVIRKIINPDYLNVPLINISGKNRLIMLMDFLDRINVDYAVVCDADTTNTLTKKGRFIAHSGKDMVDLMSKVLGNVRKELNTLKVKTNKSESEAQREKVLLAVENLLNKYVNTHRKNTDVLIELINEFSDIIRDFEPLKSWINDIETWIYNK